MLLASAIAWQVNKDTVYTILAFSAGALSTVPENLPAETERLLRNAIAILVCFYSGIWSIKLSFLIFFRQLGNHLRKQEILWWSVLGITIATYFVSLGTIHYQCLNSSNQNITGTSQQNILSLWNELICPRKLYHTSRNSVSKANNTFQYSDRCSHWRSKLVFQVRCISMTQIPKTDNYWQ